MGLRVRDRQRARGFQSRNLANPAGANQRPRRPSTPLQAERLCSMIKHKNPSALRYARRNLGFGKISNCRRFHRNRQPTGNGPSEAKAILLQKQKSPGVSEPEGRGARPPKHIYRFIVADRISILCSIHLSNGNLSLKKSNRAFAK